MTDSYIVTTLSMGSHLQSLFSTVASPAMATCLVLLLSTLVLLLGRIAPRSAGVVLAGLSALLALAFAVQPFDSATSERYAWVPDLGINLHFMLDPLSRVFLLLITGVGCAIFLYAQSYLRSNTSLHRLLGILGIFQAAMIALVTADNFILLFIAWEITSFSSYLLISFKHTYESARKAALQALLVTGFGGLALLAGLLLLSLHTGVGDFSSLDGAMLSAMDPTARSWAIVLILLGCFTKSAQLPFHFWLPAAMTAPAPVSAYLHSATMVKAGVFLMARLNPAFEAFPLWSFCVTFFGASTMLYAAVYAVRATELKKILAFTTVAALGTLTMLIGMNSSAAATAFALLLVAHALYKAPLFLLAGNIEAATGKVTVTDLGGLRNSMPYSALASTLAFVSLAGLPPMLGFLSKEWSYTAALNHPYELPLLTVAVLTNALVLAAGFRVGILPYLSSVPQNSAASTHERPIGMWLPPLILASLGCAFGLFCALLSPVVHEIALSVLATDTLPLVTFSLFHGFTLELALSLVTLLLGVGILRIHRLVPAARASVKSVPLTIEPVLSATLDFARLQFNWFQSGSLRKYFQWVFLTTLGVVLYLLSFELPHPPSQSVLARPSLLVLGLSSILIIAAFFCCWARSLLISLGSLGVVGALIAVLFALFGAPDLAATQFVVEILTVMLLVVLLQRLPDFRERSSAGAEARDITIASCVGFMMTCFVLAAAEVQLGPPLAAWFLDHSVLLGHGRNVTNVILVDFRALDTLGEIVVLAVAGLGVYALIRSSRRKGSTP